MSNYPPRTTDQPGYPAQPPVYRRQEPQPTVIRVSRRRRSGPGTGTILLIMVTLLVAIPVCLLVSGVVGFYGYYQSSGRIVPGVGVGEIELGGMTLEEATVTLHEHWNMGNAIVATNGEDSQELQPADLGLALDSLATAQKALNVAHGGSIMSESAQMFAAIKDSWQIEPVVTLDEDIARAQIEALVPQMSQAPVDATLRLEGANLIPIPSALGYSINIEETLATLVSDPQAVLVNRTLQIAPMPVMPTITDVSPAMAEAQRLMDTPVTIYAYDPIRNENLSWSAPPEVIGSWLRVQQGDTGPIITLDEEGVGAYLRTISVDLAPDRYLDATRFSAPLADAVRQGKPFAVSISYNSSSYVVQPGDTMLKIGWRLGMPYWMILQANPGLDPENPVVGQELVIPPKTDLLPLPVIPNKRIVMSIAQQRMWIYQDNQQINKFVISTGIDRSPTQPGIFQVQTHELNAYASVWDLYMPHFMGIYESWPGFTNGIHGLPTLSSGRRLWANILGSPASYGCIILNLDAGEWLYNWAENGVVVEIQQ